jgi:hypothetical protein
VPAAAGPSYDGGRASLCRSSIVPPEPRKSSLDARFSGFADGLRARPDKTLADSLTG